ncbi:MAG: 3D domain-containing protein [Planctomycetota bacterium]
MSQPNPASPPPTPPLRVRAARVVFAAGAVVFFGLLGWTTWQSFSRASAPPALAAVETSGDAQPVQRPGVAWSVMQTADGSADVEVVQAEPETQADAFVSIAEHTVQPDAADASHPSQTRPAELIVDGEVWTGPTFDGRPIRPVRTVTMRTTAYSPDERSCGVWADGITASGMSVWTNGMKLAAADPSIPFGTILTVPGYNDGHPIPVLDRGGAIKGNRLDLLYPTHDIAMQWGVQDLEVVVWEYADE